MYLKIFKNYAENFVEIQNLIFCEMQHKEIG